MSPQHTGESLVSQRAHVLANNRIALDTYLLRLECPDLAMRIRPGQFVMIRLPGTTDPLLARPFALYDTLLDAGQHPVGIDIVQLIIGKMTKLLAALQEGDEVEIYGPLGNGFADVDVDHVGLVAGGIGFTPFLAYTRELLGLQGYGGRQAAKRVKRVSMFFGARTADLIAGVDDFTAAGVDIHIATDDGSRGHHGFVTDLLGIQEIPQHLVGCGPEAMMQRLAGIASERGIPCHLSLETPMACGVGICFSCVTPVRTEDGQWDYARVCVEGPVFDAKKLMWPQETSSH